MAQFTVDAEDLREIIERQRMATLKRSAPYVVGPLAAAALLAFVLVPLSFVALGMAVAWGIATVNELRATRAAYLWKYAWMQEPVSIELLGEGISMTNHRGSSVLRWSSGIVVRTLSSCFVIEEEGDDLIVLPKRFLDHAELVALNAKSTTPTT